MRLFGLGPHFERRYAETFEVLRRETGRARARIAPVPIAAGALFVGANALALWWVGEQALAGPLGGGDLVMLLQSLAQLEQQAGRIPAMLSIVLGNRLS